MAQIIYPKFQALDDNGNFLVGGKLYTYEADTSTEAVTYSDYTLATPNTNPIILDSRGECNIFGTIPYKLVLKGADDTAIWTVNRISFTSAEDYVRPEDYGATGDGVTDDYAAFLAAIATQKHILLSDNANYCVSDSLILYSEQNIIGHGYNSKITLTHASGGSTGAILDIRGAGSGLGAEYDIAGDTYSTGNQVIGVHFVGQGVTNENGIGMTYAKNYYIDKVYFTNIGQHAITGQIEVHDGYIGTAVAISAGTYTAGNRSAFQLYGESAASEVEGNHWHNLICLNQPYYVMELRKCQGNRVDFVGGRGGYTTIGLRIHAGANNNTVGAVHIDGTAGDGANDAVVYIDGSGTESNVVGEVNCLVTATGKLVQIADSAIKNRVKTVNGNATGVLIDLESASNRVDVINGSTSGLYPIYINADNCSVLGGNIASTNVGSSKGIYCFSSATNPVLRGIVITLAGTDGRAVELQAAGGQCHNIRCDTVGSGGGIVLTADADYTTIESCYMDGVAAYGFYILSSGNQISNNRIAAGGSVSITASQANVSGNSWQPRTGAANPTGSVTPYCIGEMYIDTTNHKVYVAETVAAAGWLALN